MSDSTDSPPRTPGRVRRVMGQGLYLAPMAMQAFVTLYSIPVMVRALGENSWGQIATGQSVGLFAGTLLTMGWGITGPAMIANARTDDEKTSILYISFYTKALMLVPVGLVSALITEAVVSHDVWLAVLGAWTTAAYGFVTTWFFVGNADPIGLILFDALPRNVLSLVAWVLVAYGLPVWAGLVIQLVATIGTAPITNFAVRRTLGRPSRAYMRSRFWPVMTEQMAPVSTGIVLALFGASPLVVANLVHVVPLAPLAIADKLGKQLTTGFTPVGNILLARSSARHSALPEAERRLRKHVIPDFFALLVMTVLIIAAAIVIAPLLISVLGASRIDVPWSLIVIYGCATGIAVQGAVMSPLCLAFVDRVRAGRDAALVGSVAGILAMAALGIPFGAIGIACGVLAGCVLIVGAQTFILLRSA